MTTTMPTVEERLELLTTQVERMAGELERRRLERERWQELSSDLAPVARSAFDRVVAELDDMDAELSVDETLALVESLVRAMPLLRRLLDQLESGSELVGELGGLGRPAFERLVAAMDDAERRGYFRFARGGLGVVDRVVTEFDEDDIAALGDNIVLILNTVKEMTQPEVMTMLRRTITTVRSDQVDEAAEPPGLLALLRQMRTPEARRGLARLVRMLGSMGAEQTGHTTRSNTEVDS